MANLILTVLPWVVIACIAALAVFLAVLFVKQRTAPGPEDADPEGELEIYGFNTETNNIEEHLEGQTVDISKYFYSQALQDETVEYLKSNLTTLLADAKEANIQTALNDPQKLEALHRQISNLPLKGCCSVHLIRDGGLFGTNHLIFQFGDITRSLTSCATYEKERKFTLTGPAKKGTVFGDMWTLSGDLSFPEESFPLGDFPQGTVHIFVPNKAREPKGSGKAQISDQTNPASGLSDKVLLTRILAHLPPFIKQDELIKRLKSEIKAGEIALQEIGQRVEELKTERDFYFRQWKSHPNDAPPSPATVTSTRKLDALDVVLLILFCAGLPAAADLIGIHYMFGVVLGIAGAISIIYFRGSRR